MWIAELIILQCEQPLFEHFLHILAYTILDVPRMPKKLFCLYSSKWMTEKVFDSRSPN